jgi:hypothetical protein
MTNLTDKFTTLEEQLAAAALIIQGYTDTVEPKLQAVLDLMDVMNVNNAANTRYLLSALNAIDPCANCPPPSVIVTPPTDTPFFPGDDSCKRAQAFVAWMSAEVVVLDVVSGLGTGTFPSLLISAINEVISANPAFADVPIISFPEAVSLVGNLINYGILNIGRGDTLSGAFSSIDSAVQDATFGSTSADVAKAQYMAIVDGSSLPGDEKNALKAAAYDGLFTFFFDPSSTPDLTGFDGAACGTPEEICDTSTGNHVNEDGTHNATWYGTAVAGALHEDGTGIVFDQGYGDFDWTLITGTSVLVVSFLKTGGGVTTYGLPAHVPQDATRYVYARDAVTDCVVHVCITPT